MFLGYVSPAPSSPVKREFGTDPPPPTLTPARPCLNTQKSVFNTMLRRVVIEKEYTVYKHLCCTTVVERKIYALKMLLPACQLRVHRIVHISLRTWF